MELVGIAVFALLCFGLGLLAGKFAQQVDRSREMEIDESNLRLD